VGVNTETGRSDNTGGDISNAYALGKTYELSITNTSSVSYTIETTQTMYIPPNTKAYPVCRPFVRSVITPWACKDPERGLFIYTTEHQKKATIGQSNNISCILGFQDPGGVNPLFQLESNRYIENKNVILASTQIIQQASCVVSGPATENPYACRQKIANGNHVLGFENVASGCNLQLLGGFDTVIWQTGIKNYYGGVVGCASRRMGI
jgi:hypothetical protein